MTKAVVFGTGSWGTTFGMILAEAGSATTLWGRRAEVVEAIDRGHENPDYLPGARLPETLRATTDPAEAMRRRRLRRAGASPPRPLREQPGRAGSRTCRADAVLVSLMKGIELGTTKRMSEVICEVAEVPRSGSPWCQGPTWPGDRRSASPPPRVVACADEQVTERLQAACHLPPWFRALHQHRRGGLELGGAVKNVIALAVGIAAGMGLGDNARAIAHDPRAGRDRPAGRGARRRPAHLRRAGRAWATWWRPAPPHCRATVRSARISAGA